VHRNMEDAKVVEALQVISMTIPRDVRVLLLSPPLQTHEWLTNKPNAGLAYPNLAGALRDHGVDVRIFDASVGDDDDPLEEMFAHPTLLPSGFLRTGVSDERILQVAADYDIIGMSSIFTDQETIALHCARLIRAAYPDKVLITGGVNARSRMSRFFAAGFDVVCLSESEGTIVEIADTVRRSHRPDYSAIHGVAYVDSSGVTRVKPPRAQDMVWDLDTLPMPAWDLLPNQRYWDLARPMGTGKSETLRYANMMTSLGCPFHCSYCHISKEQELGSLSGPIGKFRVKSDSRVLAELDVLKDLGVQDLFIEDDSLLGDKKRALRLLGKIQGSGFKISDLNGINVLHLLKRWQPDHQVLEALASAGFTEISLPFETGSLRLMRKYASNKLNIEQANIKALIVAMKEYGFTIYGHYMLGYPDETMEELQKTLQLARDHVSYGLDGAHFFVVVPLPGTTLYDQVVADGLLKEDFDPDTMNIHRANMTGALIPRQELEEIRHRAWDEINTTSYKNSKKSTVPRVTPSDVVAPQ
jgi:anaerobic magnesium-protoporphyrin IX monomethyl ester cyclase